jgi:hypothetical protein
LIQINHKERASRHSPPRSIRKTAMDLPGPDAATRSEPATAQGPPDRDITALGNDAAPHRTNARIADRLCQAADILAAQAADPFRVAAYRKAAESVLALNVDLGTVAERGGRKALEAVPGVGVSIAGAIAEMLTTGRWSFLEHLKGAADPEKLFCSVPGVGPALARRVCEALHIRTLEALESAAHDGRLERVRGFGRRRAAMVRAALAELLGRVRRQTPATHEEPTVDLLLDVDREYRSRAASGELTRIAPKRFNPSGEAWLPVLHTVRDGWHFTAIYSNTARAHQLGRTSDWVVIFFHKDGWPEGQCTVVTETHGEERGRRVVRGREAERPPNPAVG